MAYRSDISIDWISSPRIITIAAPSTELTMQDLHDTLRAHEDDLANMSYKKIVDSSGKEPLGGGTKVGITVSLQNAQIAFEARPGPEWTLCNLIGGNIVAFDESQNVIEVVYPTAYVSVSKTSSASATLQEQDALQYASYDGGVSIDITSPNSGTEFPVGTVEYPVNNLSDARAIAISKGFDKYWLKGNLFITAGDNVQDFTISNRSENPVKSIVVIDPDANTAGVHINRCTISGTLDNGIVIEDSIAVGINYVNGYVNHSVLAAYEIVLGGSEPAFLINCQSGVPNALRTEPSIDLGGSGQDLILSGFDGEITIRNKTGNDTCSIRGRGHVIIDSTCTAGEIELYGDIYVTNNGTSTIIDRTTGTIEEISSAVRATPIDSNIVSVTGTAVTNVDDFKATEVGIDDDSIANAVWLKYNDDGGVLLTASIVNLIKTAKEMLYNRVTVSSDEQIVTVYDDDKLTVKHIIDVSPDTHERVPRD